MADLDEAVQLRNDLRFCVYVTHAGDAIEYEIEGGGLGATNKDIAEALFSIALDMQAGHAEMPAKKAGAL